MCCTLHFQGVNAEFGYELADDAEGMFEINPSTGIIRVARGGQALDRETNSWFTLTVCYLRSPLLLFCENVVSNYNKIKGSVTTGSQLDLQLWPASQEWGKVLFSVCWLVHTLTGRYPIPGLEGGEGESTSFS